MKTFRSLTFLVFCLAQFGLAQAASPSMAEDNKARKTALSLCNEMKKGPLKSRYQIQCNTSYHHFNSNSSDNFYNKAKAKAKKSVKVASFNLWHPGNTNTMFKDLDILADIMNKWDVVTALELVSIVGPDLRNNKAVKDFIRTAPAEIRKLEKQTRTAARTKKIKQLKKDLKQAPSLMRVPAYIKILKALRKKDKSWALIITPRGESWKTSGLQELVGFFYRGAKVMPISNEHCSEYDNPKSSMAIACIANLRKNFMGVEVSDVFSRRPFIGSFESGNFDFTVVGAHVVFGSPKDPSSKKKILNKAFGVDSIKELGYRTIEKAYGRYAETSLTLEFIQNLKKYYSEQDIIYTGDFNLESGDDFFEDIISESRGMSLHIDGKTSLKIGKYNKDGSLSKGLSSNYDHFVLSKKDSRECFSGSKAKASATKFTTGTINSAVKKKYLIRNNTGTSITIPGLKLMTQRMKEASSKFSKIKTIKSNKIVSDPTYAKAGETMKLRLFDSQIEEESYWRVYKEVISDHLPISLTCSNSTIDDD